MKNANRFCKSNKLTKKCAILAKIQAFLIKLSYSYKMHI